MRTILNGIIKENPTFALMLGLCPALAVTTKFENGYLMGLCVLFILLFSNTIISIIKKYIPENVKIPVYILIIATFVTIVEMLLYKYIPRLYEALGIYLPLVAVNCIVLGRALTTASKESLKKSVLDALGIGLGFTLSLMLISAVREILGSNTITLMDSISNITGYKAIYNVFPKMDILPIDFFIKPAGAFFTLGLLIAFMKGKNKNESN